MKKFAISLIVVALFAVYTAHQKQELAEVPKIGALKSVTPSDMPSPTASSNTDPAASAAPSPTTSNGQYKDGEYTGQTADAFYGNIQVKAIIQNGRITDVQFLQYPNDRSESIMINQQAMPLLTSEAIQAQNAQVDVVSGATDTSMAFVQSLGSALSQAH